MSKLYQKTAVCLENGFCACYVAFSVYGYWTADREVYILSCELHTRFWSKMVFGILMTGNGECALLFMKLKWFGYL